MKKIVITLLSLIFLLFFLDIGSLVNPQKYLVKYSSQGVESISYYRVKLALALGADPNIEDTELGSSIYGVYITERIKALNLLLPMMDCENLKIVINSSVRNDLFDLIEDEWEMRCGLH